MFRSCLCVATVRSHQSSRTCLRSLGALLWRPRRAFELSNVGLLWLRPRACEVGQKTGGPSLSPTRRRPPFSRLPFRVVLPSFDRSSPMLVGDEQAPLAILDIGSQDRKN